MFVKMNLIGTIKAGHLANRTELIFITEINQALVKLNARILKYNDTTDPAERLHQLKRIYRHEKMIEDTFPADLMGQSISFREEIYEAFYRSIKTQFSSLGVHSLDKMAIAAGPSPIPPIKTSFSQLLADMAPEKVTRLLEILLAGASFNKADLNALYSSKEQPAYSEYQRFLSQHSIEFLGGFNSKNFKITSLIDGSSSVLKVDNRFSQPKYADAYLREKSLGELITPIAAERRAVFTDATGNTMARSLLVTEFCHGGDLQEHSKHCKTDEDKVKSALDIYSQMGKILVKMEHDGCAFPDMKNTNWLIDKDGIVRIADTKSFMFLNDAAELDLHSSFNKWYTSVSTVFMNPPELGKHPWPKTSADQMHSYMLGKNLYQYLTDCKPMYLNRRHQDTMYDFSAPVFGNEQGIRLKLLIQQMIHPSPEQRIPVSEALAELRQIRLMPLKKDCKALLVTLKATTAIEPTSALGLAVHEMNMDIRNATKPSELKQIKARIVRQKDIELARDECRGILNAFKDHQFGDSDKLFDEYVANKRDAIEHVVDLESINILKNELATSLKNLEGIDSRRG